MRSLRDTWMLVADWIARALTRDLLPDDTARVIPVSPIPPGVRIHDEGEDRRRR
jgi:hypothetical protein